MLIPFQGLPLKSQGKLGKTTIIRRLSVHHSPTGKGHDGVQAPDKEGGSLTRMLLSGILGTLVIIKASISSQGDPQMPVPMRYAHPHPETHPLEYFLCKEMAPLPPTCLS